MPIIQNYHKSRLTVSGDVPTSTCLLSENMGSEVDVTAGPDIASPQTLSKMCGHNVFMRLLRIAVLGFPSFITSPPLFFARASPYIFFVCVLRPSSLVSLTPKWTYAGKTRKPLPVSTASRRQGPLSPSSSALERRPRERVGRCWDSGRRWGVNMTTNSATDRLRSNSGADVLFWLLSSMVPHWLIL